MIKVSIIGAGKVGKHFITACLQNPLLQLVQVYNRTPIQIENVDVCTNLVDLVAADIFIVCVKDDAIPTLNLHHLNGLVVHTSGTVSITLLQAKNKGILYPLQTFSDNSVVNFKELHCCLEVNNIENQQILSQFCKTISDHVFWISENQRKKLHLAAVFANNFSNHLIGIAKGICDDFDIPNQILNNLIAETFQKSLNPFPHQHQTGPAIRNDHQTIENHLTQLTGTPQTIYKILTKSIQETHGSKL